MNTSVVVFTQRLNARLINDVGIPGRVYPGKMIPVMLEFILLIELRGLMSTWLYMHSRYVYAISNCASWGLEAALKRAQVWLTP